MDLWSRDGNRRRIVKVKGRAFGLEECGVECSGGRDEKKEGNVWNLSARH